MRALAIVAACALGGCSAIFDGHDLRGGGGGGGGGNGGTGGSGGGGSGGHTGFGSCTPVAQAKFTVSNPTIAGMSPYDVQLGDINHDGHVDVVTANYNSANFSVLLGDGKGGFALAATAPFPTCAVPQRLVVTDLDGDSVPDVVVSCYDSSVDTNTATVNVYLNTSSTTTVSFGAPTALPGTTKAVTYIAAGKLDNNATVDLVLVEGASNSVRIFSNDGHGNFTAPAAPLTAGKIATEVTVANVNGDAVDDLFVYNYDDDDVTLFLSKPGGGFTQSTFAYDTGTAKGTLYFAYARPLVADINHDGLLDYIAASGTTNTGTVEVYANQGSAGAPQFPANPVDVITGDIPIAPALADFNCDGLLDLAVSTNGCSYPDVASCANHVSSPPAMWILPGHGTAFDPYQATAIPLGCDAVALGDFDGNGYPDLICGASKGAITVLLNTP